MRQLEARKQTLLNEKNVAESQAGRLKTEKDRLSGILGEREKHYQQAQATLNRASAVRARYPDLSMDEIKEVLDAEKRRLQQQAEHLRDIETAQLAFQAAVKQRTQAQSEIAAIQTRLAQNRDCLPDFLSDEHSRNVLGSLNADFAMLSAQPDAEAQRRIAAFAALFAEQHGKLAFLGETMPKTPFRLYNRQRQQQLLQQDLDEAQQRYAQAVQ